MWLRRGLLTAIAFGVAVFLLMPFSARADEQATTTISRIVFDFMANSQSAQTEYAGKSVAVIGKIRYVRQRTEQVDGEQTRLLAVTLASPTSDRRYIFCPALPDTSENRRKLSGWLLDQDSAYALVQATIRKTDILSSVTRSAGTHRWINTSACKIVDTCQAGGSAVCPPQSWQFASSTIQPTVAASTLPTPVASRWHTTVGELARTPDSYVGKTVTVTGILKDQYVWSSGTFQYVTMVGVSTPDITLGCRIVPNTPSFDLRISSSHPVYGRLRGTVVSYNRDNGDITLENCVVVDTCRTFNETCPPSSWNADAPTSEPAARVPIDEFLSIYDRDSNAADRKWRDKRVSVYAYDRRDIGSAGDPLEVGRIHDVVYNRGRWMAIMLAPEHSATVLICSTRVHGSLPPNLAFQRQPTLTGLVNGIHRFTGIGGLRGSFYSLATNAQHWLGVKRVSRAVYMSSCTSTSVGSTTLAR